MKKPQWLFKVFSVTLISSSKTSYNSLHRPFCSVAATTTTNKNIKLTKVLEKKLPLLIVPYHHKDGDDGSKKERRLGSTTCDDTLSFIYLFDHGDDDDDHELNKKKKKQKEEEEVYKVYLPGIADRRICGSSEGWLVTAHENSEIQLLNPISRDVVHLPPLTTFPEVVGKLVSEKKTEDFGYLVNDREKFYKDYDCILTYKISEAYDSHCFRESYFRKVFTNYTTTTTATTDEEAHSTLPRVVVAIYGLLRKLAFCRLPRNGIDDDDDDGEELKGWNCDLEYDEGKHQDGIFYQEHFYAVDAFGNVVAIYNFDNRYPNMSSIYEVIEGPDDEKFQAATCQNYLIDSSSSSLGFRSGGGDLLMIRRYLNDKVNPYRAIRFRVWKLENPRCRYAPNWEVISNLGEDYALFISYNQSFSFSASKFPGGYCRGNCIYFTDDNHELFYETPYFESWEKFYEASYGGHDMGVYNLEDGSIEKLYETSSQFIMPPPIWYVPN